MTGVTHRASEKKRPHLLRSCLQEHTRAAYRDAILSAAEEIVLRHGYQATKMADIAEATGVAVGTLYKYFENKEAVVLAITERHFERFQTHVEQPFDSDDPLRQLRQLVGRASEFVEQNGALFNLYLQWKLSECSSSERQSYIAQDAARERIASLITELLNRGVQARKIRSDIPIDQLVWALLATLEVVLWEWWRQPTSFSYKLRGDQIVTLFLDGASGAAARKSARNR